ncbi:MAG: hypothetical protein KF722_06850 [Nitrospira sp.]|nr:hypothetical protein [Nitrospira sp.]
MQLIQRWLSKGFILPAATVCVLSIPISAAQAALVTYSFTGDVSTLNGPLLSSSVGVGVGAPLSGTFTFDNSHATGGNYPGAVSGLTLQVGSYTVNFGIGANAVTVFKGIDLGNGFTGDRWKLDTAVAPQLNPMTMQPITLNGYSPFKFDLNLDREGSIFANTDMQNPPSLSSLTGIRWRLLFDNTDGNVVSIRGSLNSLTAVPLPAAVLLFGAGLISLVGLGAGGLRNLRGSKA